MILMHHNRHAGEFLYGCQNEVTQKVGACVFPRAGRRLHDDRRIGFRSAFHNRAHLLEVVDVERRNAVVIFRGVIQKLSHANERH